MAMFRKTNGIVDKTMPFVLEYAGGGYMDVVPFSRRRNVKKAYGRIAAAKKSGSRRKAAESVMIGEKGREILLITAATGKMTTKNAFFMRKSFDFI